MVISAALDLGTTVIKGGLLDDGGSLSDVISAKAPAVSGTGLLRESDPEEYYQAATALLDDLINRSSSEIKLGLASQRSTFLLWDRETSEPVTPLISWQDRRAEEWCVTHDDVDLEHVRNTGLLMSPHYPAAKLAHLFASDKSLRDNAGKLMFGQIDSYCIWRWCRRHIVDYSMAARTLLYEMGEASWSQYLLDYFGIPSVVLPSIVPTYGREDGMLCGGTVTSSVSDQASGLLLLGDTGESNVLVNLGTGGFVNVATGPDQRRADGFLVGPVVSRPDGTVDYATEGTINGIAAAFQHYDTDAVEFPSEDPLPDVFCIPDTAGIGAPFWKADSNQEWSSDPSVFSNEDRVRIMMEGVIFRVCHIIRSIGRSGDELKIYLSGGLSRCAFLAQGLAGSMSQPVYRLEQSEATLLGAARLASGQLDWPAVDASQIDAPSDAHYLSSKYEEWRAWATHYIPLNS